MSLKMCVESYKNLCLDVAELYSALYQILWIRNLDRHGHVLNDLDNVELVLKEVQTIVERIQDGIVISLTQLGNVTLCNCPICGKEIVRNDKKMIVRIEDDYTYEHIECCGKRKESNFGTTCSICGQQRCVCESGEK